MSGKILISENLGEKEKQQIEGRELIVTLELDGESFIVTLEVDGEENAKEIDYMEEDEKEVKRIQLSIVDDDKINYC